MALAFILSMPGNNAWNGKWSGEGRLYARVRPVRATKSAKAKAAELAAKGSYGYNFGDGWYARVTVKEVDAKEARQLAKDSKGFCGYEWMIDSIMLHGEIKVS